jgi:hypothetical protein
VPGQAYYRRKLAEGKSPKEALRCLKRRLSDAVYRCLVADARSRPSADNALPTASSTSSGRQFRSSCLGQRTTVVKEP